MKNGITPTGKYGLVSMAVRGHGEYCAYCKREMVAYSMTHPTRDHVMPRSKGGRKTVLACVTCNNLKGNMLPEAWACFMEANPGWWAKRENSQFFKPETKTQLADRLIAQGAIPTSVPLAYSDPKAQAAFEAVYRDRLWLLRSRD